MLRRDDRQRLRHVRLVHRRIHAIRDERAPDKEEREQEKKRGREWREPAHESMHERKESERSERVEEEEQGGRSVSG
jgi:hypothetical protein